MSAQRASQTTSESPPVPDRAARTAGLQRAAQARTKRAEKAADAAIRDLMKRGAPINFTAVARVAGVTPAFLHRHPDLALRIRELSHAQPDAARETCAAGATGEGAVIAALGRKLADEQARHKAAENELRGRIRELEAQVAALYGRIG